jgi:alpha-mannosidase
MRPALHLICGAHLDPVWQWRWEEGAAEALSTFATAVRILDEHPGLVFCHNEAVLYRWVEEHDPALFRAIRRHAKTGRWAVAGGWFLQPDVNLPGTESVIRQILEGRRYFFEKFGAAPRVACNFDSFGHSAGLPQILRLAGYEMYVHMRPQADELGLPADLYKWRGTDGSEIAAYRIAVGLYHTEYDNIEDRLAAGTDLALRLGRDVPVFWGIGDHGGGATREDLARIDAFIGREKRVRIVHSAPDRFYEAVKRAARMAPVFEGGLQPCFTGCYTSLSRIKRAAGESLGLLTQAEALRAASHWTRGRADPKRELDEAWRGHLFNDFHDVITGTCTEPAEKDALAGYGAAAEIARRARLGAAAALNAGPPRALSIPVTVLNSVPGLGRVPVEVEAMSSHRPLWTGSWTMRLFGLDGAEVPCQEERPEAILPFHDWRRKAVFMADLPDLGAAHYEIRVVSRRLPDEEFSSSLEGMNLGSDPELPGPWPRPVVVRDEGDSWGTGLRRYGDVAGRFAPGGASRIVAKGPVRTVWESALAFGASRIVLQAFVHQGWPVLEYRLRVLWTEERRRLKLAVPLPFDPESVFGEVVGGASIFPADGEEHVHGRWLMAEGVDGGRAFALGIVHSGLHGFDVEGREIRLSVLRSAAYCHEKGVDLAGRPATKFADLGVHDLRLLVVSGDALGVRRRLPALADWLSSPPFALAHLPIGEKALDGSLLSLEPDNIRLLACKRSEDGKGLIIRLQEKAGLKTQALLGLSGVGGRRPARLSFRPYEIKTLRLERNGSISPVRLITERRDRSQL